MNFVFMTVDDVKGLHEIGLQSYGGLAGIRDESLLEAAVCSCQHGSGDQYFHATVYAQASALCYSLSQNQAFVEGNKRAAVFAAEMHLENNGYTATWTEEEMFEILNDVVSGAADRVALEAWMRQKVERKDPGPPPRD